MEAIKEVLYTCKELTIFVQYFIETVGELNLVRDCMTKFLSEGFFT